jgi:hypothetical protein
MTTATSHTNALPAYRTTREAAKGQPNQNPFEPGVTVCIRVDDAGHMHADNAGETMEEGSYAEMGDWADRMDATGDAELVRFAAEVRKTLSESADDFAAEYSIWAD